MTVPATNPRVQYTADGTVGPLQIPWQFESNSHIVVLVGETEKTIVTDYTLTGEGESDGGELTWVDGRQPSINETVTIVRETSAVRVTDFNFASSLRSSSLNDQLDYITMVLQDLLYKHGLTVRVSDYEGSGLNLPTVEYRADKFLGFDGLGNIQLNSSVPASDVKYTDPPITLVADQSDYNLPSEVTSGLSEDNYSARILGGTILTRNIDFTVTADVLSLVTTPTVANGLAGKLMEVELVKPAINGGSLQSRTVTGESIALATIKGENIGFTGQEEGDILTYVNGDWMLLKAPSTDGEYRLEVACTSGPTNKEFSWKARDIFEFASENSILSISGTLSDNDVKMTNSDGDEILTKTVTVGDHIDFIDIDANIYASAGATHVLRLGLFQSGITDAIAEARWYSGEGRGRHIPIRFSSKAPTTGSVTYSVRVACTTSTGVINQDASAPVRKGGGNLSSTMVIRGSGFVS